VDWNLITAATFGEELRKLGFANDLLFPLPFADLARLIDGRSDCDNCEPH